MNRIPLKAEERTILGKKVKNLRKSGIVPAHVFGKKQQTEHVSVDLKEFLKVYSEAGESGLIDLKIGAEKIRPVLVRAVQVDVLRGTPLHIDFYQVNLNESVRVTVPIVTTGEQPELVHSGEAVVIQPMSEVEVEALPAELPENITVELTSLKQIGDAISISQLQVSQGVTIHADPEAVVVKLDNAVSEEMQKLLKEQAAEAAAAAEAVAAEGGEGAPAEGEATTEGEGVQAESGATEEGGVTEEQAKESAEEKKPE